MFCLRVNRFRMSRVFFVSEPVNFPSIEVQQLVAQSPMLKTSARRLRLASVQRMYAKEIWLEAKELRLKMMERDLETTNMRIEATEAGQMLERKVLSRRYRRQMFKKLVTSSDRLVRLLSEKHENETLLADLEDRARKAETKSFETLASAIMLESSEFLKIAEKWEAILDAEED